MTLLGPLERLHFWHVITSGRGNHGRTRGNAERRETEVVDDECAAGIEARFVFHPFKSEAME